jgi:transcription antitermination factor NusG
MNSYTPDHSWLVIKTKPRAEKKLYEQLTKAGYDSFLPTYVVIRQWSDRKKKVELPLISGVVFVKNKLVDTYSLYDFPHIIGILKEFNKPALVSQQEIENIKILIKEWNGELIECNESLTLSKGEEVEVVRGDFAGIIGELIALNGKHRLVVQLKTLNVEFTVNIPKSHVKRVQNLEFRV